jgi:hypothetical protein
MGDGNWQHWGMQQYRLLNSSCTCMLNLNQINGKVVLLRVEIDGSELLYIYQWQYQSIHIWPHLKECMKYTWARKCTLHFLFYFFLYKNAFLHEYEILYILFLINSKWEISSSWIGQLKQTKPSIEGKGKPFHKKWQ